MWEYLKQLEYPINIRRPDARAAKVIMSQYGGPNGEIGASLRYLSQKFAMPDRRVSGLLNDIGTEELAHLEMVGTMVRQLTRNLTVEQLKEGGFDAYFTDHTVGVYPASASGVPWSAATIQSVGDPIADLVEDMAAEQKARVTYDNILKLVDDPDICDPIRFLREREIVHFQRFGEALGMIREKLNEKNFYAFNPAYPNRGK
ncbi:MAG: manganese catalase family protein [Clostridia bacterium]|nr:manganese catalase family protein [Clostridia bacterium]